MNFLFLSIIVAVALFMSIIALRFKAFSSWWVILAATAVTGILNVILGYIFFSLAALRYDVKYFSASDVSAIPIEQILLSFVLPYAFLVIYGSFNASRPIIKADKYSLSISNVIMGLSIAMIFFAYNKAFALVTFSLLLLTLFYVEYRNRLRFMMAFYRAYLLALILFLLIFIPIHVLSIYKYTVEQTIQLKIAYIPFESYFYFLWMGLVTVTIYELFKRRI